MYNNSLFSQNIQNWEYKGGLTLNDLYNTILWPLFDFKIEGVLKQFDLYDTIGWLKHIIQNCSFKFSDLYFNWKYNEWGTCNYSNSNFQLIENEKFLAKKKTKNCLDDYNFEYNFKLG